MSEANILFIKDGVNLTIQCTIEDKMKDICESYSTKINKNINSLLFLYEGNKVNFNLSFKEQAKDIDRNNHQMKILVFEYSEINNLNSEQLNEIISSNNVIKNSIITIKLQIDDIIKICSNNSLNIKLNDINQKLNMINEDIKKKIMKK